MPGTAGFPALSHHHRQEQEGKPDIVEDGAGKGAQHSLPPPGFTVGADDDQGGAIFLGHAIQGAPRQTDRGLDNHLEALVRKDPPLGGQAGGGGGRQTFAGAAKEIRGDDVGQDDRDTPQTPEFAPASHDLVPSGRQVGGHDHPVKDGPHHASLFPPWPWSTLRVQVIGFLLHKYNRIGKKSMAGRIRGQIYLTADSYRKDRENFPVSLAAKGCI